MSTNSYVNAIIGTIRGESGSREKLAYFQSLAEKRVQVGKSPYLDFLDRTKDTVDLTSTICVQIPSYCDVDLINTVNSLIINAASPDRVRIKICYQDDDMKQLGKLKAIPNVQIDVVPPDETRGLCFARFRCNLMVTPDVDYVLHIDSHMRFAKFWDVASIALWKSMNDDKAILSQRPLDFSSFYKEPLDSNLFIKKIWHCHMKLCYTTYESDYMDAIIPRPLAMSSVNDDYSNLTSCISGGFTFGKAEIDREVPSDPDMYFIADEDSMAVRYWTHGYNIYSSDYYFMYHLYYRVDTLKKELGIDVDRGSRGANRDGLRAIEMERVKTMFDLERDHDADLGQFGLGSVRTLKEYEEFSGVDFKHKTILKKSIYARYGSNVVREDDNDLVWFDWKNELDKVHIGIYYIATGDYKKCFDTFIESIQNFYPECKRTLVILSDGLTEWNGYTDKNLSVEVHPLNHYPWPIVTLYKMYHIAQNYDKSFTHMCYFNSNVTFVENNKPLDFNRLNATYHIYRPYQKKYGDKYDIFKYVHMNPESSAYMQNGTYDYLQAGFFFGPSYLILDMCEGVNKLLNQDTSRHIFAQWHDESYYNKWCAKSLNSAYLVKKQFYGTKDIHDDDVLFTIIDKATFGIIKG